MTYSREDTAVIAGPNVFTVLVFEDVSSGRDRDYQLLFDEPVDVSASGDTVAELLNYGNRFPVRFIRVE